MQIYKCFASAVFIDELDPKPIEDPLDMKLVMHIVCIDAESIDSAMQMFVYSDEFNEWFEKNKHKHAYLYYFNEQNEIVQFTRHLSF